MSANGLCECGCGERTKITPRTDTRQDWVKGRPLRFIRGHAARSSPIEYLADESTECWVWQKAIRPDGYGQTYEAGTHRPRLAHRVIYERHRGVIPEGLQIDHLCRNRACVNPDHMEVVTGTENTRRGANTRLTVDLVRYIRESDKTCPEIAKELGVGKSTVHAARRGVTWSAV